MRCERESACARQKGHRGAVAGSPRRASPQPAISLSRLFGVHGWRPTDLGRQEVDTCNAYDLRMRQRNRPIVASAPNLRADDRPVGIAPGLRERWVGRAEVVRMQPGGIASASQVNGIGSRRDFAIGSAARS